MRMLVAGAGALGGFYGGMLAHAGRDVTFLVRPGRAPAPGSARILIRQDNGEISAPAKFTTAPQLDGQYDFILIAVKAPALERALEDLAPAVGPGTIILPLLNGMRHLDVIAARFGECVVGGACNISARLLAFGDVQHQGGYQDLAYGEIGGITSSRIDTLHQFMKADTLRTRISAAILKEMWEKWILSTALCGINSLMRATVGEVATATGGKEFVLGYLNEIQDIAAAEGMKPDTAFSNRVRAILTAPTSTLVSSLYRDMELGLATEADHIIGDMLTRGRKSGISTPLLTAVFANLSVYERGRGKG